MLSSLCSNSCQSSKKQQQSIINISSFKAKSTQNSKYAYMDNMTRKIISIMHSRSVGCIFFGTNELLHVATEIPPKYTSFRDWNSTKRYKTLILKLLTSMNHSLTARANQVMPSQREMYCLRCFNIIIKFCLITCGTCCECPAQAHTASLGSDW